VNYPRPTPRLQPYHWLVILRCTKKLLTVVRPQWLIDCTPDGGDWYANLLWLSGRKCLLLTQSGGLASTDIAELNQALRRNINSARGYQPPIELTSQHLRATR